MTDTSCGCDVFAQDDGETFEEERCTNQATQEDLLCDWCRWWKLHGCAHAYSHFTLGTYKPHLNQRDEDVTKAELAKPGRRYAL